MGIRDLLDQQRKRAGLGSGAANDGFLGQLSALLSSAGSPGVASYHPLQQRGGRDLSPTEARLHRKEAQEAEDESVVQGLLQAKLGHRPKGGVKDALSMLLQETQRLGMKGGMESAADDPAVVERYAALERMLANRMKPGINPTAQQIATGARNPTARALLDEMSGPGRQADIAAQVDKRVSAFEGKSKALAALAANPFATQRGTERVLKNGDYGPLGAVAGQLSSSGDRTAKKALTSERTRKAAGPTMELVMKHGISKLSELVKGKEVRVPAWKAPEDEEAFVGGLQNFGADFTLPSNKGTYRFSIAGGDPKRLADAKWMLDSIFSSDPGDLLLKESSIPQNVRQALDVFLVDENGKTNTRVAAQLRDATIAELTGISPKREVSQDAREIAREIAKDLKSAGRSIFIQRVDAKTDDEATPMYLGSDQWRRQVVGNEPRFVGMLDGQELPSTTEKMSASEQEDLIKFIQKSWDSGTGRLASLIEPEIRQVLRDMNIPEKEVEGLVQGAMPDLYYDWIAGGYASAKESDLPQILQQVVYPSFQKYLVEKQINPRPGADGGKEQSRREGFGEYEALMEATQSSGGGMGAPGPNDPGASQITDHGAEPKQVDGSNLGPPR